MVNSSQNHNPNLLRRNLRVTVGFLLKGGVGFTDGLRLVKAVENWFEIPLFALGIKSQLVLRLRRGPKFLFYPGLFKVEMFLDEPYSRLNVHDRTVIDVGALNGDSAIYFWMRGARRVIAFEPFPFAAELAERNVKLNGVQNIEIRNEAIGPHEGYVTIESSQVSNASSAVSDSIRGKRVTVRTLEDIILDLDLQSAVLKMDCEGCEYSVISNTGDEALLKFVEIIIEYHDGLQDLVERLTRLGFEVELLKPNGEITRRRVERIGLIHAHRLGHR